MQPIAPGARLPLTTQFFKTDAERGELKNLVTEPVKLSDLTPEERRMLRAIVRLDYSQAYEKALDEIPIDLPRNDRESRRHEINKTFRLANDARSTEADASKAHLLSLAEKAPNSKLLGTVFDSAEFDGQRAEMKRDILSTKIRKLKDNLHWLRIKDRGDLENLRGCFTSDYLKKQDDFENIVRESVKNVITRKNHCKESLAQLVRLIIAIRPQV